MTMLTLLTTITMLTLPTAATLSTVLTHSTERIIGHAAGLRFQTAPAVAFMGRFGFEALGYSAVSL